MTKEYILTQDSAGVVSRLNLEVDFVAGAINVYWQNSKSQLALVVNNLSESVSLKTFDEKEIETKLLEKAKTFLETNPNGICICLDRFLLDELEESETSRFKRIQVCRNTDGQKVPRQGNPPIDEQIRNLGLKTNGKKEKILIIDDGIFSGGTVRSIIEQLNKYSISNEQISILGYIGNGAVKEIENLGINVEIINIIPDIFDWVDFRDLGIFGGKQFNASRSNKLTTAIPYIYPFSNGAGASLEKSPDLFKFSKQMLQTQKLFIENVESTIGRKLTFRDFIRSGFALPTNKQNSILLNTCENATDYLDKVISLIEKEENRDVLICDMDGSLYQLNGKNGGYSGSTLEQVVLDKALEFIIAKEGVNKRTALEIRDQGLTDPIGLSAFLSRRYNITRDDYFDFTWNITPNPEMIKNFEFPCNVLQMMSQKKNTKLILLTSAPKVWQKQVIKFLGLEGIFEDVYTAADFDNKEEIFNVIGRRYKGKVFSVGDQIKTDIDPAEKLGITGIWLENGPSDFGKVLNKVIKNL